jgi:hypothetical protein
MVPTPYFNSFGLENLLVKSNAYVKDFSADLKDNQDKISRFVNTHKVSLWIIGVDASQIGDYSWYYSPASPETSVHKETSSTPPERPSVQPGTSSSAQLGLPSTAQPIIPSLNHLKRPAVDQDPGA